MTVTLEEKQLGSPSIRKLVSIREHTSRCVSDCGEQWLSKQCDHDSHTKHCFNWPTCYGEYKTVYKTPAENETALVKPKPRAHTNLYSPISVVVLVLILVLELVLVFVFVLVLVSVLA